jgi:hypothetical protein
VISPVFVFDSDEQWFPVGVEESLKATKVRLPPGFPTGSTPWVRNPSPSATALDFPKDMRQPNLPSVGYRREVKGGGLVWSQFWLWFVYNPWSIAGVGRHEGDWELVQIGSSGTVPILVSAGQHREGGKREFWACELTSDRRPVIYVARGSHAMYFAPGVQGGGIDRCDGNGRRLEDMQWRDFGPWHSWPGRWGNSRGQGRSPESPGRQGIRWAAPHIFHSGAR